ncbi:MAG: DUF2975 domain-containing protein [Oscillospiraceae bacterium]|nr:DUF2975 domain-containing protein [Oscillospiraceae bacterium]
MWNSKKSVTLSLCMTYVSLAALAALVFCAPTFLSWWYPPYRSDIARLVLITFYCCCPGALAALLCLLKLLHNIKKEEIFVLSNITLLRALSWCCFLDAAAALVSGLRYLPFLLVFGALVFLGLILRVVKNVMYEASVIKTENDLTV